MGASSHQAIRREIALSHGVRVSVGIPLQYHLLTCQHRYYCTSKASKERSTATHSTSSAQHFHVCTSKVSKVWTCGTPRSTATHAPISTVRRLMLSYCGGRQSRSVQSSEAEPKPKAHEAQAHATSSVKRQRLPIFVKHHRLPIFAY